MKITIPTVGSKVRLSKPWNFTLYLEYRNLRLWEEVVGKSSDHRDVHKLYGTRKVIKLPKDTVLRVDRIYVRKGNPDFDSISFYIESDNKSINKKRFWAKLKEVNTMCGEWLQETITREEVLA